jgi:hypothetical protein
MNFKNLIIIVLIILIILLVTRYINVSNSKETMTANNNINSDKFKLYYSPNCIHCQNFRPEWDKMKNSVKIDNIVFDEVNCGDPNSGKVCSDAGIKGYPTLLFHKNDNTNLVYNGERTIDSIVKFINNNK